MWKTSLGFETPAFTEAGTCCTIQIELLEGFRPSP